MSLIYAANTNPQSTLATGTIVNFGSAVRKSGCKIGISGGNVYVAGKGYYDLDTNVTFIATGAGTATMTLYKDGVAIPGATQTVTTTAAGASIFSIPAIVRQNCCCETSITAEVVGAGSITNAAIMVANYEND